MAPVYRSQELESCSIQWANTVSCPKCFSIAVRSIRHGWRDYFRRFDGIFPWRCGVCGARFYLHQRVGNPSTLKETPTNGEIVEHSGTTRARS